MQTNIPGAEVALGITTTFVQVNRMREALPVPRCFKGGGERIFD